MLPLPSNKSFRAPAVATMLKRDTPLFPPSPASLDPGYWPDMRRQGHQMLDDLFDHLESLRNRPVWQPLPDAVRGHFRESSPNAPQELHRVHEQFLAEILPYSVGNLHPAFMGWVHGGGTVVGMLAEMLAGGLNSNVGGRDQMPVEVERQIVHWVRQWFDFPPEASGLFVTGTSQANFLALLVARDRALGHEVRRDGLAGRRLAAYTSTAAHSCITQAMELAGLGHAALRRITADEDQRMDLLALDAAISADLAAGLQPFFVAATAGTVDIGAVDDLQAVGDIARKHGLWFHVDGAFGALAILAPELAPRLTGIQQADSIAFDFHKWGQVPYDAGFVLVRDGALHEATFASPAAYLSREATGLAGGSPWPCDFGPDLSRGFRALKTWFTLKTYGTDAIGRAIAYSCELARHLAQLVEDTPELELLAPVPLNIVCFGYRRDDPAAADELNRRIVIALHESGVAAPSITRIQGRTAIRAAIVNHRTTAADVAALVKATAAVGQLLARSKFAWSPEHVEY